MSTIFKAFPSDWESLLQEELKKTYIQTLDHFVLKSYQQGECFPPIPKLFTAFEYCTLDELKVVILGQDPYHGKGQANGMAFSVEPSQKIPSSLRNIYQELVTDLGLEEKPQHGDLTHWAKQGVLLLNTTMSVERKKPKSHEKQGWEIFTDAIIQTINQEKENIVFMLWGKSAQSKIKYINKDKHLVLCCGHPSFANMHKQWFGNRHFSKANTYLDQNNIKPIDWQIG